MTKRKFHLAKGVWLFLLCFGITFFSANHSQALLLTNAQVDWHGPTAVVSFSSGVSGSYYTDYEFKAYELGTDWIEAFCVEDADARGDQLYELIDVPEYLTDAARIASEFFSGNHGWSKTLAQIAIWEMALGANFHYESGLSYDEEVELKKILKDYTGADIINIGFVRSPPGSDPGSARQDYLISVPDASIMFLLGPALLGLGLLGRRKSKK